MRLQIHAPLSGEPIHGEEMMQASNTRISILLLLLVLAALSLLTGQQVRSAQQPVPTPTPRPELVDFEELPFCPESVFATRPGGEPTAMPGTDPLVGPTCRLDTKRLEITSFELPSRTTGSSLRDGSSTAAPEFAATVATEPTATQTPIPWEDLPICPPFTIDTSPGAPPTATPWADAPTGCRVEAVEIESGSMEGSTRPAVSVRTPVPQE